MARLRRVFDIDISRCPVCNGTLRVIAVVTEPMVIGRILEHLDTLGKDPGANRVASCTKPTGYYFIECSS